MLIRIFLEFGSQIQDRESYSLTEFTYPHIRIEQISHTQDLLISGAPSTIGIHLRCHAGRYDEQLSPMPSDIIVNCDYQSFCHVPGSRPALIGWRPVNGIPET